MVGGGGGGDKWARLTLPAPSPAPSPAPPPRRALQGYEQEVYPLRVESNGEVSVGFRGLDRRVFAGEEDF